MAYESRQQSQRVSAELNRIFAERRSQAERHARRQSEELHERYPRLRELERAVAKAGAELLQVSYGEAAETGRAQAEDALRVAEQERQSWLQAHDLTKDYAEPVWSCELCEDRGYVKDKPCPSCYRKTLIPLLFEVGTISGLGDGSFADFDPQVFRDEPLEGEDPAKTPRHLMQRIRKGMESWAKRFGERDDDLLFIGATGTGKTYLASAIARQVIAQGYSVAFLSSPTFFDVIGQFRTMKQMFNPDPVDYAEAKERYEALFEADLLVIDDLGSEAIHPGQGNSELLTPGVATGETMLLGKMLNITGAEQRVIASPALADIVKEAGNP